MMLVSPGPHDGVDFITEWREPALPVDALGILVGNELLGRSLGIGPHALDVLAGMQATVDNALEADSVLVAIGQQVDHLLRRDGLLKLGARG